MWTHRTVWYWLQADIIWRTVRLETRKVPTGCHSELTDDIEEFRENLHIQVSSVSYVRMRKPKELWSNQNFTKFSSRVLMIMSKVSKNSLNECLSECALHLGRNMSTKMDFTSEFLIQAHQSVLYHSKKWRISQRSELTCSAWQDRKSGMGCGAQGFMWFLPLRVRHKKALSFQVDLLQETLCSVLWHVYMKTMKGEGKLGTTYTSNNNANSPKAPVTSQTNFSCH